MPRVFPRCLHRVKAGDVSKIGDFEVEYIHASHSLVDCFSLAIKTPIVTVIHTGDYKIDDTPVIGAPFPGRSFVVASKLGFRRYGFGLNVTST